MADNSNNPAAWAGFKAPRGYVLGWKVVRPDGRTHDDFQWPLSSKVVVAEAPLSTNIGACPVRRGDGLCIALTFAGAASGGIVAGTGLALAYKEVYVLGRETSKLRVSRCKVLGVFDLQRLIREGHASGANLRGANLDGAILRGANLREADLGGAILRGARLDGANLYGANLYGANLYGANLGGANLDGASLREADLGGAILRGAYLRGAYLRGAYLRGAYLYGANLGGANLGGAYLRGAYLYGANLGGAILRGARLDGAIGYTPA